MRKTAIALGLLTIAVCTTKRNTASRKSNATANRYAANFPAVWECLNRLGNSAQQTFLGSLSKMGHQGYVSTTGVGTISGTPTATEFNAVNSQLNTLISSYNTTLSEMQSNNYQS